jgi:hypothetical protein
MTIDCCPIGAKYDAWRDTFVFEFDIRGVPFGFEVTIELAELLGRGLSGYVDDMKSAIEGGLEYARFWSFEEPTFSEPFYRLRSIGYLDFTIDVAQGESVTKAYRKEVYKRTCEAYRCLPREFDGEI